MKSIIIEGIEYKNACDNCGKHQAMHHIGKLDLCCYCHIEKGGIPADWHTVCMMLYKKNKGN